MIFFGRWQLEIVATFALLNCRKKKISDNTSKKKKSLRTDNLSHLGPNIFYHVVRILYNTRHCNCQNSSSMQNYLWHRDGTKHAPEIQRSLSSSICDATRLSEKKWIKLTVKESFFRSLHAIWYRHIGVIPGSTKLILI